MFLSVSLSADTSTCYNKPKSKSLGLGCMSFQPPFDPIPPLLVNSSPPALLVQAHETSHSSPDTSQTFTPPRLCASSFFGLEHRISSAPGELLLLLQAPPQKLLTLWHHPDLSQKQYPGLSDRSCDSKMAHGASPPCSESLSGAGSRPLGIPGAHLRGGMGHQLCGGNVWASEPLWSWSLWLTRVCQSWQGWRKGRGRQQAFCHVR